jgi:carboxyl-terminal processing protease
MLATKPEGSILSKLLTGVLLLAIGGVMGYGVAVKGTLFGLSLPFVSESEVVYQIDAAGQPIKYQGVKFDLFWQVWELLERKYLEPEDIQAAEMVDGAIEGMVAALGDPYTMYIPAEPNRISEQDIAGSYYGIGVELGYKDQLLAIVAPLVGSPAERAGIQPWDTIVHVKDEGLGLDEDAYDWSLEKAQSVLRGEKNAPVVLTLLRDDYNDGLPFEVTLWREEIKIDSLVLEFIERGDGVYAHLKLSRFGERTNEEWNNAVNQILGRKNEVRGVVLDLRNNPGGLVNEAIHVASEFIKNGTIVTDQGRSSSHEYTATGRGRLIGLPLVVLMNGGSASASEIVAGALRDRLQTPLVGSTTFGKGLIQQRFELDNGAGVNVTIAKWVMPGGDWLSEAGLTPDLEITNDPETEMDEVLEASLNLMQQK